MAGISNQEAVWEKMLRIKTTGRDDSRSDSYKYPYEPTPYPVLERLANTGYIGKQNLLLDYGCGKGRVDFFMSYQTRCRTIGIEYHDRVYEGAMANLERAASSGRVQFELANAEQFPVPVEVDRIYFFNPFSVEILIKALARVLESYYEKPREILFFFYYPSDEYIRYLMERNELQFLEEVDCSDLFEGEKRREKISIWKLLG